MSETHYNVECNWGPTDESQEEKGYRLRLQQNALRETCWPKTLLYNEVIQTVAEEITKDIKVTDVLAAEYTIEEGKE